MEILRRTPWSRIRERNSVYKEFFEIVGNGKPMGSVWKETIAVSGTMLTSAEKLHHQIRLRILSCSRVSENREPEVPEEKSQKHHLEGTCNNSFCEKWHPLQFSERLESHSSLQFQTCFSVQKQKFQLNLEFWGAPQTEQADNIWEGQKGLQRMAFQRSTWKHPHQHQQQ